ncbi:carboxymuconolactone decarboxylase family protein [Burkholderia sp. R-69980]|nr:carboxymuconolactone decarboxylase family protein [Burkholderia sp. R-69980]
MKSLIALFPTVLFVMPVQGNAQSSVPDTPAAREARETAPQLFAYTRDVLFGDLWKRPELVPRDRSLVTLSALLANGQAAQMTSHINLALDNGLKPGEIVALITQLAFYSGWPNAMSAVGVAKDVFAQRGIQPDKLPRESTKLLPVDEAAEAQRAAIVKENIAPMAPDLARYTDEVLFADLWRQPDLTARDRSLVTTAALIARGQLDQLPYYLSRAKEDGLTKTQAAEVATQLAFYAGWPRAMSALPIIKTVYAERN